MVATTDNNNFIADIFLLHYLILNIYNYNIKNIYSKTLQMSLNTILKLLRTVRSVNSVFYFLFLLITKA